jgi:hypothetical protein
MRPAASTPGSATSVFAAAERGTGGFDTFGSTSRPLSDTTSTTTVSAPPDTTASPDNMASTELPVTTEAG